MVVTMFRKPVSTKTICKPVRIVSCSEPVVLPTVYFALLILVQSILCLWVPVFIPLFHALKT